MVNMVSYIWEEIQDYVYTCEKKDFHFLFKNLYKYGDQVNQYDYVLNSFQNLTYKHD